MTGAREPRRWWKVWRLERPAGQTARGFVGQRVTRSICYVERWDGARGAENKGRGGLQLSGKR